MQYERVKLRTTLKLLAWTIERIDQPFTVIRMPQRRTIRRAMSFKYLKFEMPNRCLRGNVEWELVYISLKIRDCKFGDDHNNNGF